MEAACLRPTTGHYDDDDDDDDINISIDDIQLHLGDITSMLLTQTAYVIMSEVCALYLRLRSRF